MSDGPSVEDVDIRIWDDAENHRYVVEVGGKRAGLAVYHLRGDRHFFVHTEVDPEYAGKGIGRKLVKFALDDVREQGRLIAPICPFFAAYIKRNPDYDDMVDHEIMERINRAETKEAAATD